MTWPALATQPRFLQASDWQWRNRTSIRTIVVHTTECRELTGDAAGVATMFSKPRFSRTGERLWGSSQLVVDAREVWECVKPEHEAFGAKGGDVNATGYHIEHCGYAAQTAEEWADVFSLGELQLSAAAAACIAAHYDVPVVRLTPEQLAAGERGFCGHRDVTAAYHVVGGHSDPGTAFPWDAYLATVAEFVARIKATVSTVGQ